MSGQGQTSVATRAHSGVSRVADAKGRSVDARRSRVALRVAASRAAASMAALAVLFAVLLLPAAARAQPYPSRPVTLVVPFAAGGPIDMIARLIVPRLSAALGQAVVVDNRGGAGSTIGTAFVANAPPDGHTVLLASNSALAIAPHVYKTLTYDPVKSFEPVTLVGIHVFGFVVHPSVPATRPSELVEYARSKPGALNYGSSGIGTGPHLLAEALKSTHGIDATHVPYKGGGPALADLIAGRVQFMFDGINNLLPHMRSGKIRAIAIVSSKRSPVAPDVPTMSELGMFGSVGGLWSGIVAPAGTPAPVVRRLSAEMQKVMAAPEVAEAFLAQGVEPVTNTPDEFAAHIRAEIARWGAVVKAAGIKPE